MVNYFILSISLITVFIIFQTGMHMANLGYDDHQPGHQSPQHDYDLPPTPEHVRMALPILPSQFHLPQCGDES